MAARKFTAIQTATIRTPANDDGPMGGEGLKRKTLKGTVWSTVERFSVQFIQFAVMIVMAGILTPPRPRLPAGSDTQAGPERD